MTVSESVYIIRLMIKGKTKQSRKNMIDKGNKSPEMAVDSCWWVAPHNRAPPRLAGAPRPVKRNDIFRPSRTAAATMTDGRTGGRTDGRVDGTLGGVLLSFIESA